MTPADQRILQLLQKWQTSLDLHARYAALSDDQYWLVQPWPRHQRPTKWVVDLARQRVADLSRIMQSRVAAGDPSLGEALELMSFLANLVGVQSIERFIPMAETERERPLSAITIEMPALSEPVAPPPPPARAVPAKTRERSVSTVTVEMPRLPQPAATAATPVTEPAPRPPSARSATSGTKAPPGNGRAHDKTRHTRARPTPAATDDLKAHEVCNDAARLLGWGRDWHELPEAIARMADRPDASRVREILRTHRADIERNAGAAAPTGLRTSGRASRPETR